jgi:hypothetical protein
MELDIEHQSRLVHMAVANYYVTLHRLDRDDISHPDDEGIWEKMALGIQAFDPLMSNETSISPDHYDRWISTMKDMVEYIGFQRIQIPKNQRLTYFDPTKRPLESYIDTVLSVYGSFRLPAAVLAHQK